MKMTTVDRTAPEFQKVVVPGEPMAVVTIGAGRIFSDMMAADKKGELYEPGYRYHRLAFGIWDRIRTGEINSWNCTLCDSRFSGLPALSCIVVVDQARPKPTKDKPALMALVCATCDSISTEDTQHRVRRYFGFDEA